MLVVFSPDSDLQVDVGCILTKQVIRGRCWLYSHLAEEQHGQTDRGTDRQIRDRQTRRTDRQRDRQADKGTDRQDGRTDRGTDRQIRGQTDKTDRQTDKGTDRQDGRTDRQLTHFAPGRC